MIQFHPIHKCSISLMYYYHFLSPLQNIFIFTFKTCHLFFVSSSPLLSSPLSVFDVFFVCQVVLLWLPLSLIMFKEAKRNVFVSSTCIHSPIPLLPPLSASISLAFSFLPPTCYMTSLPPPNLPCSHLSFCLFSVTHLASLFLLLHSFSIISPPSPLSIHSYGPSISIHPFTPLSTPTVPPLSVLSSQSLYPSDSRKCPSHSPT